VVTSNSDWDTYALGIPLIALLVIGYFRLDEVFARKGQRRPTRRIVPVIVDDDSSMERDPDGRPWKKH